MRLHLLVNDTNEELDGKIEFLERRLYVARTMVPPGYETFFQETARYTSVHTSTAIEGNPLGYQAAMIVLVEGADPDQPLEVEKVNLDEAYELMASLAEDKSTKIDQGIIRTINSMVLKGLPDTKTRNRGKYRVGGSLIVDANTGAIRYRPPPPQWVPELMDHFALDMNTWVQEYPGPVAAALAHFGLISIHPFDDGNGRTARLVADMILNLTGSAADGMITMSKVFHDELPAYYEALRTTQGDDFKEEVDATPFVVFHTDALAKAATMLEDQAIQFDQLRKEFALAFGDALNQRQANGLMFMLTIGPISSSRYAHLTGTSQATALSDLNELSAKGLAARHGAGRSTRYELTQSMEDRIAARLAQRGGEPS